LGPKFKRLDKSDWLFTQNPDIYTFGGDQPAGKKRLFMIHGLPENNT